MTLPRALVLLLCVTLPGLSWHLGGLRMWYLLALAYPLAAALSLYGLFRDGQLGAALWPRRGDATLGCAAAAALYALFFLGTACLIAPELSDFPDPRVLRYCRIDGVWLPRPELHGPLAALEWFRDQSCAALGRGSALQGTRRQLLVVLIALSEETAWRAGVQQQLSERFGSDRGFFLASGLYALCQLTTLNLSVPLLALPAGLAWGALYRYRGRLAPALISHVVFSWFFFCVRPLLSMHR